MNRGQALRRIAKVGGDAVLVPRGFVRSKGLNWVREEIELRHVVNLAAPRGSYFVQWGVLADGSAPIVWGREDRPSDVGDALMSGTSSTVHHPAACYGFRLREANDEDEVERTAAALAIDMARIDECLRRFHTRRELRSYLLANRDHTDRRDFIIPAKLPLKLFFAATLAVLDRDADAHDLIVDAAREMAPFAGELTDGRLARLGAAAASL